MKNLYVDDGSPLYPRLGPYFSDGHRRVDYVLAYHIQKPSSIRRPSSKFGDNNFIRRLRRSMSMRSSRAPLQPKEDPEIAAQKQRTDYHEDDKRFRREEFEENLLETGLELEKDEGVRGLLKCVPLYHAPMKLTVVMVVNLPLIFRTMPPCWKTEDKAAVPSQVKFNEYQGRAANVSLNSEGI